MTYLGKVLADKPYAIWSLDDSTPFTDNGGSGRLGEMVSSGDYVAFPSLVASGGVAAVVENAKLARWYFPGFQPGREAKEFSLETWLYVRSSSQKVGILSHSGTTDGIWFNGNTVGFTTSYADTTEATASYLLPEQEAYHVVAVHNQNKNLLYVDGVLVDEAEISPEQNASGYASVSNGDYLYSGYSGAAAKTILDSVAVYGYALTSNQISNHFKWGRDVASVQDIVSQYGGITFDFSNPETDIYIKQVWNSDEDWNSGYLAGVVYTNGAITPDVDVNGNPIQGEWLSSLNLSSLVATEIDSARVYWEGEGDFTVYTSVDDTTFSAVENGGLVTGITNDFDVDGKSIGINIRFGPDVTAKVSSLTLVTYNSNTFNSFMSTRVATFDTGVKISNTSNSPIEYNTSMGSELSGGAITISEDATETPSNTGSVELWLKFSSLTGAQTILDFRKTGQTSKPYLRWTGSAMQSQGVTSSYVNGAPVTLGSYTFLADVWYHIVFVLTTLENLSAVAGKNYLGAEATTIQLGGLSIYDTQLSSSLVAEIYNQYYGITSNVISEGSLITVTEQPGSYSIYDYDWSITPAGL